MRRIFLIFAAVLCLCSSMASAAESEPDWQQLDIPANFTLSYDANNLTWNEKYGALEFVYQKVYHPDSFIKGDINKLEGDVLYNPTTHKIWTVFIHYYDDGYQESKLSHMIPTPDWQDIDEESMMEKVCDAAMKCYDEQQKHKLNN